jgi:hypothetical protein
VGEETSRLRGQFQQVGDRVEERLEGWLEEPPWDGFLEDRGRDPGRPPDERPNPAGPAEGEAWDPLDNWEEEDPGADPLAGPWDGMSDDSELDEDFSEGADQTLQARSRRPPARRPPPERSGADRYRGRNDDDPWI